MLRLGVGDCVAKKGFRGVVDGGVEGGGGPLDCDVEPYWIWVMSLAGFRGGEKG